MQTISTQPDTLPTTFEHRSVMPTTLDAMWAFHADPKAFVRLTPPPIFVQMHRNALKSLTEGEVEFTLWFAFFPVRWIARHEPGPISSSFVDRQVKGPTAVWVHRHLFEALPNGVRLTDRLTIQHKGGLSGIFTRLFFSGLPLRIFFIYRHLRTRFGVKRYERASRVDDSVTL